MDCETVQIWVVEGRTLDERAIVHLRECEGCRFVASLSRQLGGDATGLPSDLTDQGPLLGRWQLDELRGRGGQGMVYRATDLETGETVAIKVVRGDRGLSEVVNARRIRHHNVCRMFHTERKGGLRLIVMEYVDGPALSAVPRPSAAAARAIFQGIAAGVAAAHAAGVLHLDLKPGNVLLRAGEPVVTDFGLSCVAEDAQRAAGGTPRYMAPEQRRGGPVGVHTDIYALGRLLEDLSGGARWARRAVERATRADPNERPADVAALLALVGERSGRRLSLPGIALLPFLALVAAALPLALPRPPAPRPEWRASWGTDLVPREAWNVALNLDGQGLPAVSASHPYWGCAVWPWDLLDGQIRYDRWEHGVAFAPAPTVAHPDYACLPLTWMGQCGTLSPDDRLCQLDGKGDFEVLDLRARDMDSLPPQDRANLGRADPKLECGERSVTVELDRARTVVAVRTWHHNRENAPSRYRVEVWDEAGTLHTFGTSRSGYPKEWFSDSPGSDPRPRDHMSGPITMLLQPTQTRRVRFVMDTCSTLGSENLLQYQDRDAHPERVTATPGTGWLYEMEVFARLSPYEAWWRWLTRP